MTFLWTTGVKELRQQIKNNAFTYLENIRQKKNYSCIKRQMWLYKFSICQKTRRKHQLVLRCSRRCNHNNFP